LKAPNYGLLFIAAHLQKELGLSSKDFLFVDQPAGDDPIRMLSENDWDLLGASSLSVCAHKLNEVVPEVRNLWPDRLVVLGGVHATVLPEIALKQSCAQYAVVGDGERAFVRVADGFRFDGEVPRDAPGLVWLEDGRLVSNGVSAESIPDLDALPPLPLEILNRSHYFENLVPLHGTDIGAFPWTTSRGCGSRCRFCAVNAVCGTSGVRMQSAERVLDDIERLVKDYAVPAITFQDDNFIENAERIAAICEGILKRPKLRGFRWACNARADRVKEDLFFLMKKAGCVQVAFGFESGAQRVLRYLKKGVITVEHGVKAVEICHKAGIRSMGTFIVGSPSETREEVLQTFKFIHKNPIDFALVFTATPSPGSEFWDVAVERGLVDPETFDWRNLGFDLKPLLADSLDPAWLYRKYWIEYVRISMRNYSFPVFMKRAVKAAWSRLLGV
jgi:radical SAM superfamily enzyme YgiQ (UPF0313 family)